MRALGLNSGILLLHVQSGAVGAGKSWQKIIMYASSAVRVFIATDL